MTRVFLSTLAFQELRQEFIDRNLLPEDCEQFSFEIYGIEYIHDVGKPTVEGRAVWVSEWGCDEPWGKKYEMLEGFILFNKPMKCDPEGIYVACCEHPGGIPLYTRP